LDLRGTDSEHVTTSIRCCTVLLNPTLSSASSSTSLTLQLRLTHDRLHSPRPPRPPTRFPCTRSPRTRVLSQPTTPFPDITHTQEPGETTNTPWVPTLTKTQHLGNRRSRRRHLHCWHRPDDVFHQRHQREPNSYLERERERERVRVSE